MTIDREREVLAFIADLRALEHDDKADLVIDLMRENEALRAEVKKWRDWDAYTAEAGHDH